MPDSDDKRVPASLTVWARRKADKPSIWRNFLNGLRQTIGLKPLYLTEQWAESEIRKRNSEARRNEAEANRHEDEGAARKMEAAAKMIEALQKFDVAKQEAAEVEAGTRSPADGVSALARALLDGKASFPGEALEALAATIRRIQMQGGQIKIDLPDSLMKTPSCEPVLDEPDRQGTES